MKRRATIFFEKILREKRRFEMCPRQMLQSDVSDNSIANYFHKRFLEKSGQQSGVVLQSHNSDLLLRDLITG